MNELPEQISLLIADDHQMVIDGISSMLAGNRHFNISATATDGSMALEQLQRTAVPIHILITDISMPQLSGIELCKQVKKSYPGIKVLILSMYHSVAVVKQALLAEADGYILKNAGRAELLKALHRIADGGTYFTEDILPIIYNQYQKEQSAAEALQQLSKREQEVLSLIVREHTSEEIGKILFISKKTVDNHRANLLEKTGCNSTIGLVKYAIRHGLDGGG
jgi:two-component system nitrate/nitrite response regulator NarL